MDNAELAIGIDLGTTNSLIAVWKDGAAQLIPNKFGEYLTPSIISMDENNHILGSDSNLLIVFYVQIMPDDLVMQLHRF
ncbi:chaperone HscC [Escherichia coli]|nr:chaperone HscC [Escherichia coli]